MTHAIANGFLAGFSMGIHANEKLATLPEDIRRSAGHGAAIGAVYGGLLHGLNSRRDEDGERHPIRDAAIGALLTAPKGALIGAGYTGAAHLYRQHLAANAVAKRGKKP